MARPVIYVLAGVNGAGKSSIGGHLLTQAGMTWFNPDSFARELVKAGYQQPEANATAWHEGLRRLDDAIANFRSFAFETTLGGNTIPARLHAASATHDVIIWFCGLSSPEQHIARVQSRVAMGGHDITPDKIRERFSSSRANLIGLMPCLDHVRVYDNSQDAAPGNAIPDPILLLELKQGHLIWPISLQELQQTPDWAKPLLEAAIAFATPAEPI